MNFQSEHHEKVEAQRKYLGGDSEHSILVKGLDFALLEQNKAKATIFAEDVDALDQAFLQSSSSHHEPTAPKKRTREDIIRELKEQRAGKSSPDRSASQTSEVQLLEEAKQRGKFKPIGFKPIGSSTENKRKKTKTDNLEKEEKKKKRKPNGDEPSANKAKPSTDSMPPPSSSTQPKQQSKPIVLEEPIDHDFDIFADAGEYEGIDIGDDDDDEDKLTARPHRDDVEEGEEASTSSMPRRWISGDEPVPILTSRNILPLASGSKEHSQSYHGGTMNEVDEEVDSDEQPMRLAPLASSVLPSIKDLLAMDKAASSYDKKKRNDKKSRRGGDDDDDDSNESKKKSVEAKVDRDYKRLVRQLFLYIYPTKYRIQTENIYR